MMDKKHVNSMFKAAKAKDGAGFKVAFDKTMTQKVGNALQQTRQDIAKNTFGGIKEAAKQMTDAEKIRRGLTPKFDPARNQAAIQGAETRRLNQVRAARSKDRFATGKAAAERVRNKAKEA